MLKLAPVASDPFTLRRRTGDLAEGAARLARDIEAAPVARVLADANRTAVRRGPTTAFGQMDPRPVDWFTLEDSDDDTRDWYPQGLTCASDAGHGSGAFIASWYWKPELATEERGIRLTFLDPENGRYRHVLAVTGRPDGGYSPIDIHAGGVAWYRDHLYVADTTRGLRVFDLRQILDLRSVQDGTGDRNRIGRKDGGYHAYGYRYILPQCDAWRPAVLGARFSFASVDRSAEPDLLVGGEYVDRPGETGRLARWRLASDGTLANREGTAEAEDAYRLPAGKIQGAVSHRGTWYLSQAGTGAIRGSLLVGRVGEEPEARAYPFGPEDLTVQRSEGRLWSITEFPRRRALFAVPL
ncbi:hypothetical protein [Actinocorallia populi]|uniref:hypothetical protein n=1 Tax=Actinocorallia populi TaxID=2079200 RepID=UPI000D0870D0|nr:hypothetical protein [Actinocorallia populi]